jgi:hypothetical protein
MILQLWYKDIEDHLDQITSLILYKWPHNYDWSITDYLIDHRKMRRKVVNKLISR